MHATRKALGIAFATQGQRQVRNMIEARPMTLSGLANQSIIRVLELSGYMWLQDKGRAYFGDLRLAKSRDFAGFPGFPP